MIKQMNTRRLFQMDQDGSTDGLLKELSTSPAAAFEQDGVKIVRTDCLQLLASMPDNSVDLIATDPPYYKVKADDWDRQWETKQAFFDWLGRVLSEFERVLKPTGSLYLFCGPYLAAETELLIGQYLRVLNHISWRKPTGRHLGCNKESLRKYFPQTERVIFAESRKKTPFLYGPIQEYLVNAIEAAGLSRADVNKHTGTKMAGHWFARSQFSLISEEHYLTLQRLGAVLKPYAELKEEYVRIRDQGKGKGRYFAVTKEVPYTDVWDFSVVNPYPGKHPCEKPLPLMEHIINTSSQPGDTVFDAFVGSGSTPIAAYKLGRKFVGSEMGEQEFAQALARLKCEALKTE